MKFPATLLFILFFLSIQPARSQSKLDSLLTVLGNSQQEDSSRVLILLALSEVAFGKDFQAAERYAIEAIDLSKKIGFQQGVGLSNLAAGRACIYLSKGEQGLQYFHAARQVFEAARDTANLADVTRAEGIIILNFARYDEAIALFEKGAALAQISGDLAEEAFCVMDIGIAYIYLSGREKALEYFLKALKIAERSRDKNALGNVKNSIGQIYYEQEKYPETKQMMEEALDLALAIDNPILVSDCYFYLSRVAMHDGKLQEANLLNAQALHIDSLQSNLRGLAHKHVLDGDIFLRMGRIGQAQRSFQTARAFTDRIQDKEQTLSLVLIRQGKAATLNKRYTEAIDFLEQAATVAQQGKLLYWEYEAYENLAKVYERLGEYQNAYQYHQRYVAVKDSVVTTERDKNFNQLQAEYEDEKKKAEIARLSNESIIQQQQLDLQRSEARQKTQQNILLLAILGGVIIMAGVLWVLFRNKSKNNRLLTSQNEKIELQNHQKEILLKEIHHRVKNNLQVISSLLSLQSNNIEDKTALSAVQEGQNRVKSIALIHQKLYQHEDISRVDFDEYVNELVFYLRSTFQKREDDINILINTHGLSLDIDTAVPLGLIVNELVSNSFKYAFSQTPEATITIELTSADAEGKKLHLIVADNGVGIPEEIDLEQVDSLGLKLVRMLCQQLDGDMSYSNGQGSKFDIFVSNTSLRKQVD